MFDIFIKVLKEQKGILLTIIIGLLVIGVVLGAFRKEKIKVREIDPTMIYREEVLSKIKNEENIKPENIEDIIKENVENEQKEIDSNLNKDLQKDEKRDDILKIEKTPMDELIEK